MKQIDKATVDAALDQVLKRLRRKE